MSHTEVRGVIIDDNLTLTEQLQLVETQFFYLRLFMYFDCETLRTLYETFVEPYNICHIAVEMRINLDSENYLCYRKKLYE